MVVVTHDLPNELEFFERGFGYSNYNEHDEGLISYLYQYEKGRELIITFEHSSVSVKIIDNNIEILSISQEKVSGVDFQSWGNEKVLRIYLKTPLMTF